MQILPGFAAHGGKSFLSSNQLIIYAVEHYILIGLYTYLLVLVLMNFWNIIIRQKKYKSLPLLTFYIFASIAISFRLIILVLFYTNSIIVSVIYVA